MSPYSPSDAPCVDITQTQFSTHRYVQWPAMKVELVNAPQRAIINDRFKSSQDWAIAPERSGRDPGERSMSGLPKTTLHSLSGQLTFVAASHEFDYWQRTRHHTHACYISIDPPEPGAFPARGGLGGWRRKRVTDYIEEHLTEVVRLSTLAALVDLSPYHFVRAFRQSFGVPPHRYHVGRRIERAKMLLAEPANSVTAIARSLGFAETSSFSATFRRVTGCSPSEYRHRLG